MTNKIEIDSENYLEAEIARMLRNGMIGKTKDDARKAAIEILRKKLYRLKPIGIKNASVSSDKDGTPRLSYEIQYKKENII